MQHWYLKTPHATAPLCSVPPRKQILDYKLTNWALTGALPGSCPGTAPRKNFIYIYICMHIYTLGLKRDPDVGSTQTLAHGLQHPSAGHGRMVPGPPPPHGHRAPRLRPLTWMAPLSMAATSPMAMARVCASAAAPGPRAGLTQARCSVAATNSSTCQQRVWGRAVGGGRSRGSPGAPPSPVLFSSPCLCTHLNFPSPSLSLAQFPTNLLCFPVVATPTFPVAFPAPSPSPCPGERGQQCRRTAGCSRDAGGSRDSAPLPTSLALARRGSSPSVAAPSPALGCLNRRARILGGGRLSQTAQPIRSRRALAWAWRAHAAHLPQPWDRAMVKPQRLLSAAEAPVLWDGSWEANLGGV